MFSAIVLEHFNSPRHVGPLETATHHGVAGIPGDGPYMLLWFEVADRRIRTAAYQTYGCPAAVACGSIAAQVLTGRTVDQALSLTARDIDLLLQGLPDGKAHCPLLAIKAIRNAFHDEEK